VRVIAFSDAHLASAATIAHMDYSAANYENIGELLRALIANPPDVVVNLGDWWEPFYDASPPIVPEYERLKTLTRVIKTFGNHDPKDGQEFVELDGIRYEHGHACGKSRDVQAVRAFYANRRIVHGHTHAPFSGLGFDVGSISFTGTYGEIIDGTPCLKRVGGAA